MPKGQIETFKYIKKRKPRISTKNQNSIMKFKDMIGNILNTNDILWYYIFLDIKVCKIIKFTSDGIECKTIRLLPSWIGNYKLEYELIPYTDQNKIIKMNFLKLPTKIAELLNS